MAIIVRDPGTPANNRFGIRSFAQDRRKYRDFLAGKPVEVLDHEVTRIRGAILSTARVGGTAGGQSATSNEAAATRRTAPPPQSPSSDESLDALKQ